MIILYIENICLIAARARGHLSIMLGLPYCDMRVLVLASTWQGFPPQSNAEPGDLPLLQSHVRRRLFTGQTYTRDALQPVIIQCAMNEYGYIGPKRDTVSLQAAALLL
jgi:hypothetical protein